MRKRPGRRERGPAIEIDQAEARVFERQILSIAAHGRETRTLGQSDIRDMLKRKADDLLRLDRSVRSKVRLDRVRRLESELVERRTVMSEGKTRARLPCFVYVIGAPGYPVKIGIAVNVDRRLADLSTSSPARLQIYFSVEVANARAVEHACHVTLDDRRLNGEWFDITPQEAIDVVTAEIGRTSTAA